MDLLHWPPNFITAAVCCIISRSWIGAIIGSAICGVAIGIARQGLP